MLSFGIKEARRAEEFAKTKEQKETVMACVRMMNIPITVQKQSNKKAKKLQEKIGSNNQAIAKLKCKTEKAEAKVDKQIKEKFAVASTLVNWSF